MVGRLALPLACEPAARASPKPSKTLSFPSRQTLIFSRKTHSDAHKSRFYSRIIVFCVAETIKNTIILE